MANLGDAYANEEYGVVRLGDNVKSGPSEHEVLVRFVNYSQRNVDLIWINFDGRGVRYAVLRQRQYIDITTFVGHPWVFRCNRTGDWLVGQPGGAKVYYPQLAEGNRNAARNIVTRVTVLVCLPLESLRHLALKAVSTLASHAPDPTVLQQLPLPRQQVADIARFIYSRRRYLEAFSQDPLVQNNVLRTIDHRMTDGPVRKRVKKEEKTASAPPKGTDDVHKLIRNAVMSDPSSCMQQLLKLRQAVGQGATIASEFIKIAGSLTHPIPADAFSVLDEHWAMLGVDSACEYLADVADALHKEQGKRNLTLLLSRFVGSANVLGYEKLRELAKHTLTAAVNELAGERRDCSLHVARQLCYVLLAEQSYVDPSKSAEQGWTERVGEVKSLIKSPLMAVLHVLLVDQTGQQPAHLTPTALDKMGEGEGEMAEAEQLSDLLTSHISTVCARLGDEHAAAVLGWLARRWQKQDRLAALVSLLDRSPALPARVWPLITAEMLRMVQEDASACDSVSDLGSWMGSLAEMMAAGGEGEKEKAGVPRGLRKLVSKWAEHDQLATAAGKVKTGCSTSSVRVAAALAEMPLKELLPGEREQNVVKVALLLLGTLFHAHSSTIFASAGKALSGLVGGKDSSLPLTNVDADWLRSVVERWSKGVATHVSSRDSVVVVCAGVLECIPSGQEGEEGGGDGAERWTVVEKMLDGDEQWGSSSTNPSDECERRRVLSAAVLETRPWQWMGDKKRAKMGKMLGRKCVEPLIGEWEWQGVGKDEADSVEQWSYVWTVFARIPSALRSEWVEWLVGGEDKRRAVVDAALSVLSPSVELASLESWQVAAERALSFLLSSSAHFGASDAMDKIADWKILSSLIGKRRAVVEEYISRLAPEKACLSPRLSPHAAHLTSSVCRVLEECAMSGDGEHMHAAMAAAVRTVGGTKSETVVVSTVLGVMAVREKEAGLDSLLAENDTLYAALKHATNTVTNDQCALFSQLFARHLAAAQHALAEAGEEQMEKRERLQLATARLAHQLKQYEKYFNKLIASLVGDCVLEGARTELAMCRLGGLMDKWSSAHLATTLPAKHKRVYARLFPQLQKAKKMVV